MFYERFHKHHHLFVGVRTVAAQSLHPVETVLQTFPNLLSVFLHLDHPLLWLHFLGWRVYQGMEGHSGFAFRHSLLHKIGLTYSDDSLQHDAHHLFAHKGNFGAYWLDWLFGTNDHWVKIGMEDGYIEFCKRQEREAQERALAFAAQDQQAAKSDSKC